MAEHDGIFTVKQADEKTISLILDHSPDFMNNLCVELEKVYLNGDLQPGVYSIKNNVIGKGSFGKVYQACNGKDCNYVAKWIEDSGSGAIEEAKIQQKAALLSGVVPKIYEIWVCEKGVLIIMQALSFTLASVIEKLNQRQREYVENYIENILEIVEVIKKKNIKLPSYVIQYLESGASGILEHLFSIYGSLYGSLLSPLKFIIEQNKLQIEIPETNIPPDTEDEKVAKIEAIEGCIRALQTLTDVGIAHGDIHSNNLMSDGEGNWYVIDFGSEADGDPQDNVKNFKYDLRNTIQSYTNLRYLRDIL